MSKLRIPGAAPPADRSCEQSIETLIIQFISGSLDIASQIANLIKIAARGERFEIDFLKCRQDNIPEYIRAFPIWVSLCKNPRMGFCGGVTGETLVDLAPIGIISNFPLNTFSRQSQCCVGCENTTNVHY